MWNQPLIPQEREDWHVENQIFNKFQKKAVSVCNGCTYDFSINIDSYIIFS